MNILLRSWSAYTRATATMAGARGDRAVHSGDRAVGRRHRIRNIPARLFSGAGRSRESVLQPHLPRHPARLSAGQPGTPVYRRGARHGHRHSLGDPDRHQQMGAPHILADPFVLPGHRRHRLAADPADLVRLWLDHHDLRDRLHRAISRGAQHRARRRIGAARSGACRAQPRRVAGARVVGGDATRRAAQYHYGIAQRPRLRLARADRGRDDRRHQRHRLSDVRRAPFRLGGRDPARHDHSRLALVHRGCLDPCADRARDRPALGIGNIVMKTLELRNLQKTYFDPYAGSHVTAVHDVSLEVQQGDFVSVVGPSGCGKTTILNMVAGFIPHSGGEILLNGKAVSGPGPERGVVFQSFALFPWKTVLDNVGFGPKMRGVPKAERDKIAHEYLALAGLSHAANRYPNELSGGMQQRVGVVRALANNPEVLLMDEPFASVDAQTRMTLQEELTRIWQERRPTVIFITHDVAEAVFLANRVVVLSKGRVLDQIEVALPRPRVWDDLIEDETFKRLSAHVLQMVRSA